MDWYTSCSYEPDQKRRFHAAARTRLRRLAAELGFPPASFDLRSNQGGIAVSGEITLHHARIYVQVCQPATRADSGILIRTCEGRRDYTGGRNHFAPLSTRCASASAASARRHSGVSRQGTDGHGGERWRGPRRLRGRGGPGRVSRTGSRESAPAVRPVPALSRFPP